MPRTTQGTGFGSAGAGSPAVLSSAQKGVFRKEGEYWTVGLGSESFRLKDSKGLVYLAHLLRHPAAEFHVLDLIGGIAGQNPGENGAEHTVEVTARSLYEAVAPRLPDNVRLVVSRGPERLYEQSQKIGQVRAANGQPPSASLQTTRPRSRSRLHR